MNPSLTDDVPLPLAQHLVSCQAPHWSSPPPEVLCCFQANCVLPSVSKVLLYLGVRKENLLSSTDLLSI